MGELVSHRKEGAVGIITIDHPPLNVMSTQVQKEIRTSVEVLKNDEEVVCVVLTTAGEKAFMAGADIKEFPSMIGDPEMTPWVMELHAIFSELDDLPKPTIAVLDGLTLGGGCELALTFDIRIAEEHAKIGLPEVNLGLFPGGGGTQRLPRLVGEAKAKEIMFTGEPITAQEAERIGLVNQVVPTGEGFTAAMEMAAKIAGKSLQSLSRIKRAVDEGVEKNLKEGLELEAELFTDVFQTEDVKEGVEAFIQKRKANFTHK
ncbi:enoyl-CoA hydratase/isomerase family protein [Virgibacillus kekensis]|uniref:Enoyl-CoA hydratase/isomerase family protein n=1 Tax=Virgibacillus kekensis TaxID=202261 RepID=A0ABV9DJB2_9BACI